MLWSSFLNGGSNKSEVFIQTQHQQRSLLFYAIVRHIKIRLLDKPIIYSQSSGCVSVGLGKYISAKKLCVCVCLLSAQQMQRSMFDARCTCSPVDIFVPLPPPLRFIDSLQYYKVLAGSTRRSYLKLESKEEEDRNMILNRLHWTTIYLPIASGL